ncbi:tetratricopeptide repeat domain 39B [Pitangus sulphuratus]|nr:tetratricopeptide repeat domain 39B [Pitangus sulphuratus]
MVKGLEEKPYEEQGISWFVDSTVDLYVAQGGNQSSEKDFIRTLVMSIGVWGETGVEKDRVKEAALIFAQGPVFTYLKLTDLILFSKLRIFFRASKMDLKCALEECSMALNLFLNNKFSEALELLRPWSKDSMYHALGYSTILVMQAAMTFEQQDIQMGISTMKEALQTCQRFRKRSTVVESLSNLVSKQSVDQLSEGRILRLLEFIGFSGNRGSIILFYAARIDTLKGNFEKAQLRFQDCIAAQQEWKQIHHLCYWELMWCYTFQQDWLQAYRYADLLSRESRWSKAIYVFQKAAILCMLPEDDLKKTGEDIVSLFRQVDGLKQRIAGKSIPTEKFAVRKARRYASSQPVKLILPALEMMYVWNGFAIVGKRSDLTENLLVTIEKEETALQNETNHNEYYVDDVCMLQLLKGLCLKHLGRLMQAELCFSKVIQRSWQLGEAHGDQKETKVTPIFKKGKKEDLGNFRQVKFSSVPGKLQHFVYVVAYVWVTYDKAKVSEKQIKYDSYLVPFTLYELGLLYKQQDEREKAIRYIETAKDAEAPLHGVELESPEKGSVHLSQRAAARPKPAVLKVLVEVD